METEQQQTSSPKPRTKTREEKIAALKLRGEQIKAKVEKLEAAEEDRDRKQNERRKYVIGAAFLAAIQADTLKMEKVLSIIDRYNARPSDRALFGLPAKVDGQATTPAPTQD
jgi:hypothetical protein